MAKGIIHTASFSFNQGKVLGGFPKDKYDGDFFKDWNKAIDQAGFEKSDASALISAAMSVKDDVELNCVKKAAELTNKIFTKYLKEQIITAIDSEKVFAN